jgi:hypothetical protein
VLDREGRRVLGFDVLCGDERRRFLPIGAGSIGDDAIAVASALLLFGEEELTFYRRRGRTLSSQRGLPVQQGSRLLGHVLDVEFTVDGTVVELVVAGVRERERVLLDDTVKLLCRDKAA